MAVATIGVFGVMALIPFAVNQSQRGLDSDLANSVGRNAIEMLQIQGVFDTTFISSSEGENEKEVFAKIVFPSQVLHDECETIFLDGRKTVGNYSLDSLGLAFPSDPRNKFGLVHLDPIGVAYAGGPITSFTVDEDQAVHEISIPSVTLRNDDPRGIVPGIKSRFSFAEALSLCSTGDDLVTGSQRIDPATGVSIETLDIAPPQQYHDMAGGRRVKRQAARRISWSVLLNPSKNDAVLKESPGDDPSAPGHFKAWVLTYSGRSFDGSAFRTRITNPPGRYGLGAPADRLPELLRLSLANPIDDDVSISKGSWVMLINLIPVPDYKSFNNPQLPLSQLHNGIRYRADEEGYDKQIQFARVTKVDRIANEVAIDGCAFEIFPIELARSAGTYMVFIPDVINVYERTVKINR